MDVLKALPSHLETIQPSLLQGERIGDGEVAQFRPGGFEQILVQVLRDMEIDSNNKDIQVVAAITSQVMGAGAHWKDRFDQQVRSVDAGTRVLRYNQMSFWMCCPEGCVRIALLDVKELFPAFEAGGAPALKAEVQRQLDFQVRHRLDEDEILRDHIGYG